MTPIDPIDRLHAEKREFSKPGLSRVSYLLERAGNPQDHLKFVHVAGTDGKGSCASYIAAALTEAGFVTGLYTSPDVFEAYEGITVDGARITCDELSALMAELSEPIGELDGAGDGPTPFEIVTACVFMWFSRQKCDICVVECGMGGLYDATNVIPRSEVSVLMNIGKDHVKALGNTVTDIAKNKAGIIKPGSSVVFYGGDSDVLNVISRETKKNKGKLTVPDYEKACVRELTLKGTVFDYKNFKDIRLEMPGRAQIKNCCCAAEALIALGKRGFAIPPEKAVKGFGRVRIPGRFEVFSETPAVIYDGAHNVPGWEELTKNLEAFFPGKKVKIIAGIMADKNREAMIRMLKPFEESICCVTPLNKRALDGEKLRDLASASGMNSSAMPVRKAIEKTIGKSNENDVILVTGSLYLYKEARPLILEAVRRKEKQMSKKILTVAIDGPSGAGKSTVAKAISSQFKIGYLDTGAMYRAVALYMVRSIPEVEKEVEAGGLTAETTAKIVSLLDDTGLEVRYDDSNVQHVYLGEEDVSGLIRTPIISMAASKVSAIPEVRVFLVAMQREIGSKNSIVMDGRDIGTHVLTNASVKIFLTASPEERAKRRYKELLGKGMEADYETVLKDIIDRDYGDSHRAASPLKQAEDAVLLDTSDLGLEESVAAAVGIVTEKTGFKPVNGN